MEQRFLVVYDYGQGGVWAFIHARSKTDIERAFPDLEVVEELPKWMTAGELEEIEQKMTFDLDEPDGWLAKFAARRKTSGKDVAAG